MQKQRESQGCVYCVRNRLTGAGYTGQHCTLEAERRWNTHLSSARSGCPYPFHCALRKYGYERGFTWEVVWRGPVSKLNEKEAYYIKKLNTFIDNGHGYNLTTGGDGHGQWSEEIKIKISKSGRGKKRTPETKRRVREAALRRPPISDAARANMSAAQFGREHSDETCSKISNALRGKSKSVEHCKNMSIAAKRRAADVGWRAYMSDILTGRVMSEEARIKMSVAHRCLWGIEEYRTKMATRLGPAITPEFCARVSAGLKRVWADEANRSKWVAAAHAPEVEARRAEKLRGRKHTPEQRAAKSVAAIERWRIAGYVPRTEWKRSPEIRANMAAARRKTWALKGPAERAAITAKSLETKARNKATACKASHKKAA